MYISKTNVIKSASPSIPTGASSDLPSNVTNADFSTNYTASGSRLVMRFGSRPNVNYIAVCASNVANGTITVRNGDSTATFDSVRGEYNVARPHVCMFVFDSESFSDLVVVVDSKTTGINPIVSYVAAGQAIEIPNGGEGSGYGRNWLARGVKSRTTGNKNAQPTANLIVNNSLRGALTVPNVLTSYSRGDWQEFFDFAASGNPFFINEVDSLPESSYICFDPTLQAPKAHPSTRSLDNISINFRCSNGL